MKKLLFITPVLAALALSACGSSGSGSTGTQASASSGSSGSTTTPNGQRGFLSDEVRSCLKKQGVDLPDRPQGGDGQPPQGYGPPAGGLPGGDGQPPQGSGPPADGGGPGGQTSDADRQKMQDALKACGVQMPDRADGQGGEGFQRPDTSSADYQKRVNAYVACVRQNGFDLPDPDFSGDGPIFDPDQVDQTDKTFQAASAKCQDELRPPAGATSTTS